MGVGSAIGKEGGGEKDEGEVEAEGGEKASPEAAVDEEGDGGVAAPSLVISVLRSNGSGKNARCDVCGEDCDASVIVEGEPKAIEEATGLGEDFGEDFDVPFVEDFRLPAFEDGEYDAGLVFPL